DRTRGLVMQDALHLVPFLAVVLWALPVYLMSGADKLAFSHRLQAGARPLLIVVADPLKYVSGVSYAVATVLFLRRHRERVKESYSSIERVNLRWLLWLGAAATTIWVVATALDLLETTGTLRLGPSDDFVA